MKLGDSYIGSTSEEIGAIIMGDDIDAIKEIMENNLLEYNGRPRPLTFGGYDIEKSLLSYASVLAGQGRLSKRIATLFVDNLSVDVDVFLFIGLLKLSTEHGEVKEPFFPSEIKDIIINNEPNDELSGRIAVLKPEQFFSLCEFINGYNVEKMNVAFTVPIIRYAYNNNLVSLEKLFSFMAGAIRKPNAMAVSALDIIGQVLDGLMDET